MKHAPHSKEAEQSVMGCVLLDNGWIPALRGMLKPEMFFSRGLAYAFKAALDLYDGEDPVDEVTLGNRLRQRGQLESMGGVAALAELVDQVPVSSNAMVYAEVVRDAWMRREAINATRKFAEDAVRADGITGAMAALRATLDAISKDGLGVESRRIGDIVRDVSLALADKNPPPPVARTFIPILDELLGGFGVDRPTIVAARTGVGKTVFCIQTAVANAKRGLPVLLLNLEMDEKHIGERVLSAQSGVAGEKLRARRLDELTEKDWDAMARVGGDADAYPLFIVSPQRALTVDQIEALVARHVNEHGVGLVVVDHLKRIRQAGANLYEKQTERMAGLCRIQTAYKVPVLIAAQIGRDGVNAPGLEDLKGSGDLEEDAGAVILLHDQDAKSNTAHTIEVVVAKNGQGRKGAVDLLYLPWKYTITQSTEQVNYGAA